MKPKHDKGFIITDEFRPVGWKEKTLWTYIDPYREFPNTVNAMTYAIYVDGVEARATLKYIDGRYWDVDSEKWLADDIVVYAYVNRELLTPPPYNR